MIGEPDAGKPHVRFDEGVQETCDIAARLRPTLPEPPYLTGRIVWPSRPALAGLPAPLHSPPFPDVQRVFRNGTGAVKGATRWREKFSRFWRISPATYP